MSVAVKHGFPAFIWLPLVSPKDVHFPCSLSENVYAIYIYTGICSSPRRRTSFHYYSLCISVLCWPFLQLPPRARTSASLSACCWQSTAYHHSHTEVFWLKMVPRGHRNENFWWPLHTWYTWGRRIISEVRERFFMMYRKNQRRGKKNRLVWHRETAGDAKVSGHTHIQHIYVQKTSA